MQELQMTERTVDTILKKIDGPAAWNQTQMLADTSWSLDWSKSQIDELIMAGKHFLSLGLPLENISKDFFPLNTCTEIINKILADLLQGRGFVLLRGLPVRDMGHLLASVIYLGLGVHLGSIRSNNGKGHLLGHVKDQGVDVNDKNVRIYQTNKRLDFHTDSSDFVALLCLQKSKAGGESYIASSMSLFQEMARRRPDLVPFLFDPYPTDRRGEVPAGQLGWFNMPIFTWHAEQLTCVFIRQYIESAQINFPDAPRLKPEQIEVMNVMDEIIQDSDLVLPMSFEPGDIQILHNHQILHSRNDFENWPEPERQRHLLRLWVSPENGRALPEYFVPRWGSVQSGHRGGIIVPGVTCTVSLEF
jgi:hypothetical protein